MLTQPLARALTMAASRSREISVRLSEVETHHEHVLRQELLDPRLAVGEPVLEEEQVGREARVRLDGAMRGGIERIVQRYATRRSEAFKGLDDPRPTFRRSGRYRELSARRTGWFQPLRISSLEYARPAWFTISVGEITLEVAQSSV